MFRSLPLSAALDAGLICRAKLAFILLPFPGLIHTFVVNLEGSETDIRPNG